MHCYFKARGGEEKTIINSTDSYLLLSSVLASRGKKSSAVGKKRVPRVSGLETGVPPIALLIYWPGAAAAARPWSVCRLVSPRRRSTLLQPQESRCRPARSVQGHDVRCLLGCHPYSTPGWSHCGHHSLTN